MQIKKIIIINIMILSFILLVITKSYAASGTVDLKINKTEVKKGEEFTVILNASSESGINGIDTKYMYDNENLELINANVVDSVNWSSLGTSQDITIICNSSQSIKNADIYMLTFKVKDSANVGIKTKIETTNILLDTDEESQSEIIIEPKSVEVLIINEDTENSLEEDNKENLNDLNKDEVINKNENINKENNDSILENLNKTEDTYNEVVIKTESIRDSHSTVHKDDTSSKKSLPNTGMKKIILPSIILIIMVGYLYIKCKGLHDIK